MNDFAAIITDVVVKIILAIIIITDIGCPCDSYEKMVGIILNDVI